MDKKTDKHIRNFLDSVKKNSDFIKAYIFGSYAKGNFNENSDIDIALILKGLKDSELFDKQVELMLLSSKFDLRIEPHPISSADFNINNPFAAEIMATGFELK